MITFGHRTSWNDLLNGQVAKKYRYLFLLSSPPAPLSLDILLRNMTTDAVSDDFSAIMWRHVPEAQWEWRRGIVLSCHTKGWTSSSGLASSRRLSPFRLGSGLEIFDKVCDGIDDYFGEWTWHKERRSKDLVSPKLQSIRSELWHCFEVHCILLSKIPL